MADTWTITQNGETVNWTVETGVGPAGPNEVTTATETDLTGYLKGNGSVVSSQAVPIPITDGGTGGITASAARTALGVERETKSANFTAVHGGEYVAVATLTVTDPTPDSGVEFAVIVRNGTATVGGTAYATAGTVIRRIYHSGAWANYVYKDGAEYAAAVHTHVSADITDATTDGFTNPGKILKTTASGMVTVDFVTVGAVDSPPSDGHIALVDRSNGNTATIGVGSASSNRDITLPNATGNLALTAQTDGTIRGTDLDYANTTDIGADLADADEVLVSDGGGNTTRRKSALSRFWTYITGKIAANSLTVGGDLTVDTDALKVDGTNNRVGVNVASPLAPLQVVGSVTIDSMPCSAIFCDPTTPTKRVNIGYNTSNACGEIQAVQSGSAYHDMILNPYGGRVGVGAAPIAKFSVAAASTYNSVPSYNFVVVDSTNTLYRIAMAYDRVNDIAFIQSVLENTGFKNLSLNPNGGNVGIGTISPSVPLDVTGNAKISGDLTVDTSTLKVDSANNRVGIGTASPSVALDVVGAANISGQVQLSGTPKVSAYKSSDQSLTGTGTWQKVTYDTEYFDVASNFASSTFTAPFAGYVRVTASVFRNGSADLAEFAVYKNGSRHRNLFYGVAADGVQILGSTTVQVALNDTLEIYYLAYPATTIRGYEAYTYVGFEMIP